MENEILTSHYLYEVLSVHQENEQAFQELKDKLAASINELLPGDFNKLVELLYRLDIDENRLRTTLQENSGKDAGILIADLIIERQIRKIKTREQYKQRDETDCGEERW